VGEHALKFLFKASNNEVEYEALQAGMDLYYALGAEHLCAFSDSQLVVSQVTGEYEASNVAMVAYLATVKEHSLSFKTFEIKHVPRSENRQADALLNLASSSPNGHPKSIRWKILHRRTITPEIVAWVDRSDTWMNPLVDYLCDGSSPLDAKDASHIKNKFQWFLLYGEPCTRGPLPNLY